MPLNPTCISEAGWLLGARHLMEGAARMSEVVRLVMGFADQHYGENRVGTPFAFDTASHFSGVYGLARKVFYKEVGHAAAEAEAGFAFACDVALNCPAPPVFPFPPENPGIAFLRVCKALAGFRFDRALDMRDDAQVRALLGRLTEHVGANPDIDLDLWTTVAGREFAPLDVDETAAAMYTFDGHDLPDPLGNGARLRYSTALSLRAIGLRAGTGTVRLSRRAVPG